MTETVMLTFFIQIKVHIFFLLFLKTTSVLFCFVIYQLLYTMTKKKKLLHPITKFTIISSARQPLSSCFPPSVFNNWERKLLVWC